MARAPDKAADLKAAGAEVVQGDLIDPASLEPACSDVDGVLAAAHALMGTGSNRSEAVDDAGHRALLDAAQAAGVKRFVYTSARGASETHPVDFFRTKAGIEQCLVASGLSYTILRPSAFMEWHVHNLLGKSLIESGKTTIFGSGDNPTNFVAASDVARFAVIALTDPATAGRTLEIGGLDNPTKREVADMYARFSERAAKVRHVPTGVLRVSASLSFAMQMIAPRLPKYRKLYPNVRIHIETANRYLDVIENDIDVAIRTRESEPDSNITIRSLAKTRRVLAASPGYLAARGVPLHPEALSQHDLLLYVYANNPNALHFTRGAETKT